MEKYLVCKVLIDARGKALYMPVGHVDGADNAIQFNINNSDSQYIALMTNVFNSEQITLNEMTTDTITSIDSTESTGLPFDRIVNVSGSSITLGNQAVIPSGSYYVCFWNYTLFSKHVKELLQLLNDDKIVLYNTSVPLDKAIAQKRLVYMRSIVESARIFNEEDRLLWNQFVGNMIVLTFRQLMISQGVDASQGMAIQSELVDINLMCMNGQLAEANYLILNKNSAVLTTEMKNLFSSYINSCAVEDLSDIDH